MKKDIVLIGGGGHCESCVDVIEQEGRYRIAGIVDLNKHLHKKVMGYKIFATDKDINRLVKQYKYFIITIGQITDPSKRINKYSLVTRLGGRFPIIISPSAYVSKHASIQAGTIVMHGAIVNAGAKVGENCILNTNSLIEHSTEIGDHTHISTKAIINGDCRIGKRVFVGSNAVCSQNLCLADDVLIGAGAVVIRSIPKKGVFVGSPAQRINE